LSIYSTSKTIFAFNSLTGFAAGWSTLEFVFILTELARNLTATSKDLSPFELYGEGIMLTAAFVICTLQQEWFVFATNVGRRLQMVRTINLPDQNHASAQFNYAFCLEDGEGVVKDKAEAARYYKLAVDQNDADAQ
jgi:hypothetical protein